VLRQLLGDFADVRYVWRHLPLNDVHPRTQLAAEASEAAANQGAFWEMHDLQLRHQDALDRRRSDALRAAAPSSTSSDSWSDCKHDGPGSRVADDVDSADLSGVTGDAGRSSSTVAATTARTTSTRCRPRFARRARERCSQAR
jgi:hypothetical protein